MDFTNLLRTLLAAMTPIGELRLAIPFAIWTLGMPWYQALPISLVGNILPVLIIIPGLDIASRLLTHLPGPGSHLLNWRIRGVQRTYAQRFHKYGPLLLVGLVAVPLPFTGAWTGALAAWVFQVPYRIAVPLISLGVVIAGVLVTLLVEAGVHIWLVLEES